VEAGHALEGYVCRHGATNVDLEWFHTNAVSFDILGANYYPWSYGELKKWPDGKFGTIVRRARGHKIAFILRDAWQRYRMPIMITETSSTGDTRTREKWMDETLETVRALRAEGIPVIGYTWFPLFTMVDWKYRKGRQKLDKYLAHLGLYDSAFDAEGVLQRHATPLVKHYHAHIARPMTPISASGV
jgi:hypothetical protein